MIFWIYDKFFFHGILYIGQCAHFLISSLSFTFSSRTLPFRSISLSFSHMLKLILIVIIIFLNQIELDYSNLTRLVYFLYFFFSLFSVRFVYRFHGHFTFSFVLYFVDVPFRFLWILYELCVCMFEIWQ